MKILVGSKNPVKIDAVRDAFHKYFDEIEVIGYEVDSGVPHQPVNDETFAGAKNRAVELQKINSQNSLTADFFVGIEGGITKIFDRWFALGLMCIINKDGLVGFGTSPLFELPAFVINKLLNGTELGDIIDNLMSDDNTKQKGGAISYFTNGIMNRKELYTHGLIAALVPFNHQGLFFPNHSIE